MAPITALSVHQPWADQIASGAKTTEYRSWATRHRGPLLICATQRPCAGHLTGVAICLVDVTGCTQDEDGTWLWHLANPRPVPNFPVRGKQRTYPVELPADVQP